LIDAQRVDFIAVPVQDRERAARFYEETLGLPRNPNSTDTWIEFETGNVTLEGNGLAVHHRYAPYRDGTLP
jgi:extradiol dioxygenase family protein